MEDYVIVLDTDVDLSQLDTPSALEVRCAWCEDASGEHVTSTICATCEQFYFPARAKSEPLNEREEEH